jgi:hypothetical protein
MSDNDTTYIDLTDPDTGDTITVGVPYNYDDYDTYSINTTDLTWGNISLSDSNAANGIQVRGKKGTWDVEDRIREIERVLNIPERDYDMEAKHPELKDLYEKHMRKIERVLKKLPAVSEYEREVEKHRMWETLTGPDRNINGGS